MSFRIIQLVGYEETICCVSYSIFRSFIKYLEQVLELAGRNTIFKQSKTRIARTLNSIDDSYSPIYLIG